jgi:hypothetical protein
MKRRILLLHAMPGFAALAVAMALQPLRAAEIPVVVPAAAASAERIAARELADTLGRIFPRDRFVVGAALPAAGKVILVGRAAAPEVRRLLGEAAPTVPESFVVRRATDGRREIGLIAGADARGTAHGVYAVLAKLGCGFSLSGDMLPAARAEPFAFDGWDLVDRPLTRHRIVFNWHNFLSGCSTWNLADWRRWTEQSQKLGYNAIMVHAYGNNPMAGFDFEGVAKPVGFLSTTVKGRDWSTMHVNDVRRLFGGSVFNAPAFGADAGLVADDRRVAAAQGLMREVFADAAERAMDVFFAVDVDTPSANPPELVRRLPESARFEISSATTTVAGGSPGRIWVPNPDTPEGYAFVRAQVAGLVAAYPQVTHLVVWFRRGGTPWMDLKPADLPAAWQQEFAAEIARTPEAEKYWRVAGLFAVGKIIRAFDRALKEIGASRIELAAGSWAFEFLPAADRFFPPGVPLIGLDWDVLHEKPQLGSADSRAPLRAVGTHRPVIPVVWAHHDDGHYLGRPYTPLPEFAAKLADAHAAGFGIIHWTTRPLDLYFASLARQTWAGTQDQPLSETSRNFAAATFGAGNRESLGRYLEAWLADAPRFARETSDFFIDRKLTNIPAIIAGCRTRLAMFAAANTTGLTPEQRDRLAYQRGLEEFIADFHEAHGYFQDSQDLLQKGDLAGARAAILRCRPERVIERFAEFSSLGGITRGEQGVVVTMNTRWLSHIVRHRQALGLEPVRINFAPTSHDLLAQSRGKFTFHFDSNHRLWETRGTEETGAETFVLPPTAVPVAADGLPPAWAEIGRAGIVSAKPLTLLLRPIMAVDSRAKVKPVPLPAGDYRLRLLFLEREHAAPSLRVIEVAVRTPAAKTDTAFTTMERVDIAQIAGGPHRLIERSYPVRLAPDGSGVIELRLTPIEGQALLCGVVVEPAAAP